MTLNELVEYAKRRLSAGQPRGVPWADDDLEIAAAVPSAAHELAVEVMRDDRRRGLLQQQYTITLDGFGVGDPAGVNGSVTSAPDELLFEGIPLGMVLDAAGVPLHHIRHYADFISPQPLQLGYYTLRDGKIHTRLAGVPVQSSVDVVSAAGPLTVLASYSPASVTDWPAELEDDLVSKLVTVIARKVEDATA